MVAIVGSKIDCCFQTNKHTLTLTRTQRLSQLQLAVYRAVHLPGLSIRSPVKDRVISRLDLSVVVVFLFVSASSIARACA